MHIWFVPVFVYYEKRYNAHLHKCLCEHMFSFLLEKHLEVVLLDRMLDLCLNI